MNKEKGLVGSLQDWLAGSDKGDQYDWKEKPSLESLQEQLKIEKDPEKRKAIQFYIDSYEETAELPVNILGEY